MHLPRFDSVHLSRRSLLTSIGAGSVAWSLSQDILRAAALTYDLPHSTSEDLNNLHYGNWSHDDAGLPCFDAALERHPAPFAFFCHLMSTGTIGAVADQWGNLKLISTEDGPVSISPASGKTRSGLYAMLESEDRLSSLIYSELNADKRIRYGTGYIEYSGALSDGSMHLTVRQEIYAPPNKSRSLCGQFTLQNSGRRAIRGKIRVCSDIFIRPGPSYAHWVSGLRPECGPGFAAFRQADAVLGDVFLTAGSQWTGSAHAHTLQLSQTIDLLPGQTLTIPIVVGYGNHADYRQAAMELPPISPQQARQMWQNRLSSFSSLHAEAWMEDECRWSLGQLFSFENYDRILDEHYLHLGGYSFFPDIDNPRPKLAFTVREAAQNALVISRCEPALAKSTLRWLAKMQLTSGDIPKNYNFTQERLDIVGYERDSDTEIWFLMALCEYIDATGDLMFLDDRLSWFPKGDAPLWDHVKRAFEWITQDIGVGRHGLIRILDGDWNDYLSTVGAGGRGESVMNSGMAARVFDSLAGIARKKGDLAFASQAEAWRDALRAAVGKTFDTEWFTGCFSDSGMAVAAYGDRLYLNAQSWAVLGKCGTREQRIRAMTSAARECASRIGLMLMSKAYSSPAPADISWCPIPCGEGENGGVWPQASYWAVWAMAEEGMFESALTEWKKATLRNHARACPEVPYGIYNAPDCWSSRLAGTFEGWTQYNLFNRDNPCPMSPMIAWQAFTLRRIEELRKTPADQRG